QMLDKLIGINMIISNSFYFPDIRYLLTDQMEKVRSVMPERFTTPFGTTNFAVFDVLNLVNGIIIKGWDLL
ncbi:TPA: hypothetical protein ACP2PP_004817, partial [Escherichia coli]